MITILLEIQDKKIYLWVNHECIKEWKRKYTCTAGAPLELARHIESAFAVANVPAQIEFGDGFEDLRDLG